MARLNNAKAAEAIANREVFDTYRNSLRGRKTFDGWGDLPESKRIYDGGEARVTYWVYSYDTPIAWVDGGYAYMPDIDLSPTTRTHQELTARALGVESTWGPRVHMTETYWEPLLRGPGKYGVTCRCGWESDETFRDRHDARKAGDAHLDTTNRKGA